MSKFCCLNLLDTFAIGATILTSLEIQCLLYVGFCMTNKKKIASL